MRIAWENVSRTHGLGENSNAVSSCGEKPNCGQWRAAEFLMRGAGGDLISPAGVENIRGGKHHCCLCRKKTRALIAPTQIFKSTCRADDAVRDLGGIFADLAMPAVVAFAGPSVLIHFYALSILERHHLS